MGMSLERLGESGWESAELGTEMRNTAEVQLGLNRLRGLKKMVEKTGKWGPDSDKPMDEEYAWFVPAPTEEDVERVAYGEAYYKNELLSWVDGGIEALEWVLRLRPVMFEREEEVMEGEQGLVKLTEGGQINE